MALRPRVDCYRLSHALLLDRHRKLADRTHAWKDLRTACSGNFSTRVQWDLCKACRFLRRHWLKLVGTVSPPSLTAAFPFLLQSFLAAGA
jgi:hypothetical protein